MFMPDAVYRSVVFLGYQQTEGEWRAVGTAFFVWHPVTLSVQAHYLVTAAHVLREIANGRLRRQPYEGESIGVEVRFNRVGGSVGTLEMPWSAWKFHDDPNVDVAVAAFPHTDELDHTPLPSDMYATASVMEEMSIGIGDEVYLAGLFTKFRGESRNIPIVRSGIIAAVPGPSEAIAWDDGARRMEAYLIEARSIGGLSGSPVCVHTGHGKTRGGASNDKLRHATFYLLGIMHGHWSLDPYAASIDREKVNTGIAIVVPISRVDELISGEPFKSQRHAEACQLDSEKCPGGRSH